MTAVPAVAGEWLLTIGTPVGRQTVTLVLHEGDGQLSGEARGAYEIVPLNDLVHDGERLTWSQRITRPLRLDLRFEALVDGDALMGTSRAGRLPSSRVTGTRLG